MLSTQGFWIAIGQFILIDILLGGDNAVVIALACHKLPPKQRTRGILWGTAGAVLMRIILIFFALKLLGVPFLKILGALLLIWIGIKLLVPEQQHHGHARIRGSDRVWGAVRTIILADLVMSVDNVIAIAGAAETAGVGETMMPVILGVMISVPIIVWGSQLVIKLMDRFPVVITLGGMLLGWIAGTMLITDPTLVNPEVFPHLPKRIPSDASHFGSGIAGALLVLIIGRFLTARHARLAEPALAAAAPAGSGQLRCILLAVDGSDASVRATRQVVDLHRRLADPAGLDVLLINVQHPVSGDVSSFVSPESLNDYHQQLGEQALARSRALLDAAGVHYRAKVRVGIPGETIADEAGALACDLIVMGTKGMGVATTLLGSVAQSTIEAAGVPVMLVK